jgi:hypothetical protein
VVTINQRREHADGIECRGRSNVGVSGAERGHCGHPRRCTDKERVVGELCHHQRSVCDLSGKVHLSYRTEPSLSELIDLGQQATCRSAVIVPSGLLSTDGVGEQRGQHRANRLDLPMGDVPCRPRMVDTPPKLSRIHDLTIARIGKNLTSQYKADSRNRLVHGATVGCEPKRLAGKFGQIMNGEDFRELDQGRELVNRVADQRVHHDESPPGKLKALPHYDVERVAVPRAGSGYSDGEWRNRLRRVVHNLWMTVTGARHVGCAWHG